MNSVLSVYDIPKSLKIANPSATLRRYGIRINLSAWIFPSASVPTDILSRLREQGATVHIVEFAEQSQEKILELATNELRRHAASVIKYVTTKTDEIRMDLEDYNQSHPDYEILAGKTYRQWRSALARARRELISAQQCAMGFSLTRETQDATDALRHVLEAQLSAALAWKEASDKGVLANVSYNGTDLGTGFVKVEAVA